MTSTTKQMLPNGRGGDTAKAQGGAGDGRASRGVSHAPPKGLNPRVFKISGTSNISPHDMADSNQVLHGDQWKMFIGTTTPVA